jgi:hypothetical protein
MSRPSANKRKKEKDRQERQLEKLARRKQRRNERAERTAVPDGVDPDIAAIVPGPQPDPSEPTRS